MNEYLRELQDNGREHDMEYLFTGFNVISSHKKENKEL